MNAEQRRIEENDSRANRMALQPQRRIQQKHSWAKTAKAMAEAGEDWSEWDATVGDGLE
jgi:hypothetical protein